MSDKTTVLTYDQLSNEEKVYMFEFIFAEAVRIVMQDAQITAYTQFVTAELQQERPRVDIFFSPSGGQGRWNPGNKRECAWKGQFDVRITTSANMEVHGRLVSKVRALLHQIAPLVNNTPPMEYHVIHPFSVDAGTSYTMQSDDGYFQTQILLDIDFSIQANAWTDLIPT